MPGIRINTAAELLGISASTLRGWEERHGFPRPHRTSGNHRHYDLEELEALRDALSETTDVGAAIEIAVRRGRAPVADNRLLNAFKSFDEEAADQAMEHSLAIRSLLGSVEQVLLKAVDAASENASGAEAEFGVRWAVGWLHAARRLAPVARSSAPAVLLLDTSSRLGPDGVHTQTLELALRMRGIRVLVLPPDLPAGRFRLAVETLHADATVLCGSREGPADGAAAVLLGSAGPRVFGYRLPTAQETPPRLEEPPSAAAEALIEALG